MVLNCSFVLYINKPEIGNYMLEGIYYITNNIILTAEDSCYGMGGTEH